MLSRHGIGATLWSVAADEGQKQLSHAFDFRATLLPASGLDGQGQRGHLSPTHADTRQMRNGGRSSILTSLGLAVHTSDNRSSSAVLPRCGGGWGGVHFLSATAGKEDDHLAHLLQAVRGGV